MTQLYKRYDKIILLLIIVGLFFTTPDFLLFYDAPEYIEIVRENTLLKAVTMGHMPIHPVFIFILWITTRLILVFFDVSWQYAGNLSALTFGAITLFSLHKLLHLFFKNKFEKVISLIIFSFFPLIWIINSNLMVESIMLPSFIGAVYFSNRILQNDDLKSSGLYVICIFVLIGAHIQTLYWLPAIFAFNLIINGKSDSSRLIKLGLLTSIGFTLGLSVYVLIYFFTGMNVSESVFDLFFGHHGTLAYNEPLGYLRMVRNILLNISRSFGVLSVLLLFYLFIRSEKDKLTLFGWGLLGLSVVVMGAIWSGDYMQRRMSFLAIPLAIMFVKQFGNRSFLIVIYLFIMLTPNIHLYSQDRTKMPLFQINNLVSTLPKNETYIQTHYVSPFVKDYQGNIIWVDRYAISDIKAALAKGRVFIDSQGIKAPYFVYSGNNYHITSVSDGYDSEAKGIFKEFNICYYSNYGEIVMYEIVSSEEACQFYDYQNKNFSPGEPSIIFPADPLQIVNRRRVDYGDILTWGWYFVMNKRDAVDWIYADTSGNVPYIR